MKNMKVSMKLIVSFLIVVVLAIVIGITGIYGLTAMGNAADVMYSQKALPLSDLTKATEYFLTCRIQARSAILYTGDTEALKPVESSINDCLAQFETAMNDYKPSIQTEKGLQLFTDIMDNFSIFKPAILQVVNNAKGGASQMALLNEMGSTLDSTNAISSSLSELVKARMDVMNKADEANRALQRLLLIIILAVIAVSVVVALLLAFYISKLISKPILALTGFMNQAGQTGDITLRPADIENISKFAQNKDEIGQCIGSTANFVKHISDVADALEIIANGDLTVELALLSEKDVMGVSLRKMVENLNHMFAEINSASAQVTIGSKQISDGAQTLAQGSTEQASAVQQLSASISNIAEKTKENAKMANQAADLAHTIMNNAEKGSQQMDQMMDAVKEINTASQNISKVIKVIDDIAFQTNILALNAAVEAARAGQHGKGFAVVAEEVRSLAAKSAEAAKETGGLIANSMEKAELGSRIAGETAGSLSEIVSGINESSRIVNNIAKSSEEQSQAIGQVNTGIDQVAQVVQQNSATAEQSAAASEEMSGQSHALENLIAQFKLKNASGADYGISSGAQQRLVLPSQAYESRNDGFGKY